jgi:hypothetical protein
VAKGELVPARALTKEPDNLLVDLAVPVSGTGITFDAAKGDRVDIWAVPKEDELKPRDPKAEAIEVVKDVQLMSLPKSGGIAGGGGGAATVRFSLEDHPNIARMVLLAVVCDISIVEHVAPKPVGGN